MARGGPEPPRVQLVEIKAVERGVSLLRPAGHRRRPRRWTTLIGARRALVQRRCSRGSASRWATRCASARSDFAHLRPRGERARPRGRRLLAGPAGAHRRRRPRGHRPRAARQPRPPPHAGPAARRADPEAVRDGARPRARRSRPSRQHLPPGPAGAAPLLGSAHHVPRPHRPRRAARRRDRRGRERAARSCAAAAPPSPSSRAWARRGAGSSPPIWSRPARWGWREASWARSSAARCQPAVAPWLAPLLPFPLAIGAVAPGHPARHRHGARRQLALRAAAAAGHPRYPARAAPPPRDRAAALRRRAAPGRAAGGGSGSPGSRSGRRARGRWARSSSAASRAACCCSWRGAGGLAARSRRARGRAPARLPLARLAPGAWRPFSRPGGQAGVVLVTLGLAVMLIVSVAVLEGNLRRELAGPPPSARRPSSSSTSRPDQVGRVRARVATASGGTVPSSSRRCGRGSPPSAARRSSADARQARGAVGISRASTSLTWAAAPPGRNTVVAGRWWTAAEAAREPQISVEDELARTLGVRARRHADLRRPGRADHRPRHEPADDVDWRTFGANFFVIFSPGALEAAPRTYLATADVPPAGEARLQSAVVAAFPEHDRDAGPRGAGARVGHRGPDRAARCAWWRGPACSPVSWCSPARSAITRAERLYHSVDAQGARRHARGDRADFAVEYALLGVAAGLAGTGAGRRARVGRAALAARGALALATRHPRRRRAPVPARLALAVGFLGTFRLLGRTPLGRLAERVMSAVGTLADRLRTLFPEASGRSLSSGSPPAACGSTARWRATRAPRWPRRQGHAGAAHGGAPAGGAAPARTFASSTRTRPACGRQARRAPHHRAPSASATRTTYRILWDHLAAQRTDAAAVHRPPAGPRDLGRWSCSPSHLAAKDGSRRSSPRGRGPRYVALVEGACAAGLGHPDRPPGRGSRHRVRIAWSRGPAAAPGTRRGARWGGRPSPTTACWSGGADATLLEIALGTGRRHQIRVQLAALGHPVVGDGDHGPEHGRLRLHAARLGFVIPLNAPVVSHATRLGSVKRTPACPAQPIRFDSPAPPRPCLRVSWRAES